MPVLKPVLVTLNQSESVNILEDGFVLQMYSFEAGGRALSMISRASVRLSESAYFLLALM